LEIGCGMGLLLLRIAPQVSEYTGIDFSPEALAHVRREADRLGLAGVTLHEQRADDLGGLPAGHFDLVVLNSVVQYFPGLEYLEEVLRGAAERLAPGGRIFLGDLRSLPLLEAFHTAVELQQADGALPLGELRERIEARARRETELVIDPAFFADRGEIQLKRGRSRNELTRFRYDAVLPLDAPPAGESLERWLSWSGEGLTLSAFRRLLADTRPASLGLRGVPNGRVTAEVEAVRLLGEPEELKTVDDLQRAVRSLPPGLDPEDFWALERALSYRVEVRWGDSPEVFDVILRMKRAG
jgi:SAM-dependent methyltransferase